MSLETFQNAEVREIRNQEKKKKMMKTQRGKRKAKRKNTLKVF